MCPVAPDARNSDTYVPTEDDIVAIVVKNHHLFVERKLAAADKTKAREAAGPKDDRSPMMDAVMANAGNGCNRFKFGAVALQVIVLSVDDRISVFEREFKELYRQVVESRTGGAENHPILRYFEVGFLFCKENAILL